MLPIERQNKLLELINQKNIVTVEELMEEGGTSKATVRRDINDMAGKGLIQKVRGGAKSIAAPATSTPAAPEIFFEPSLSAKSMSNIEEKQRIANEAVKHINPGDRIILDSGTTTFELARLLCDFSNLTVITNDLRIALEINTKSTNKLAFIGGLIRDSYCSSYGYYAENMLKEISADKLFLSVDALDPVYGIMSYIMDDVNLKIIGMEKAAETYMLCDHSKMKSKSLFSVGKLDKISLLISGTELSDEIAEQFIQNGIPVVRV